MDGCPDGGAIRSRGCTLSETCERAVGERFVGLSTACAVEWCGLDASEHPASVTRLEEDGQIDEAGWHAFTPRPLTEVQVCGLPLEPGEGPCQHVGGRGRCNQKADWWAHRPRNPHPPPGPPNPPSHAYQPLLVCPVHGEEAAP